MIALIPNTLYVGKPFASRDKIFFHYVLDLSETEKKPEKKPEEKTEKNSDLEPKTIHYTLPIAFAQDLPKVSRKRELFDLIKKLSEVMIKDIFGVKKVLITCSTGKRHCVFIACCIWYWIYGVKDFDPVSELKRRCLFEYIPTKTQCNYINETKEKIQKTMLWFNLTKRKEKK